MKLLSKRQQDPFGKVLINDGVAIQRLLSKYYDLVDIEHIGNYVFKMTTPEGTYTVYTEPANQSSSRIRIKDIKAN